MASQFADMMSPSNFFRRCFLSLVTFNYSYKFHVIIITSSGVICNINMCRKNKLRIFIFFELTFTCSNWNLLVSLKLKMCSFVSIIKRSISLCSPLSALSEYRYHCISKTHDFTDFNMLDLNKKLEKEVKTIRFESLFPHFVCSMEKEILKKFAKFTGKHLCQSLFFNKAPGLRTPGTFFTEYLGWLLFFLLDSFFLQLGWYKFVLYRMETDRFRLKERELLKMITKMQQH